MSLHVYNSYTRQKEKFEPITPGRVGLYVCGPTVSGESHMGHARPYITFDVIFRYLTYLGNKVRYVRNVTDAGHFEEEGREAEDKIGKKAVLEKLEPMELVQKYTNLFHWAMKEFNNIEPSIEPTATGHIVEQIEMIKQIMIAGYAYESNGSVYFDVKKYAQHYPYGKLSGRVIEDLLENTRALDGQEEKRASADFALWKAATPGHIMRWPSPWGEGFPGWHIECSAMSKKYLGDQFDIHGGGMDLQFPHHESEIAQSSICNGGHVCARYWIHNNMITINGKKMGKSYNNVIKLTELFSGNHPMLEKAYSPMAIRFSILQTHYRSTLDFSNEALQAAEKGLKRLWEAYKVVSSWQLAIENRQTSAVIHETSAVNGSLGGDASHEHAVVGGSLIGSFPHDSRLTTNDSQLPTHDLELDAKVKKLIAEFTAFMDDDFNTAKVLANMFELVPIINGIKDKHIADDALSNETLLLLQKQLKVFLEDIFGLKDDKSAGSEKMDGVIQLLIGMRKQAKQKKDYATSDIIRKQLQEMGIELKDEKDGNVTYSMV